MTKDPTIFNVERIVSSINDVGKHAKECYLTPPCLTHSQKLTHSKLKMLSVIPESTKLLEENIGKKAPWHWS